MGSHNYTRTQRTGASLPTLFVTRQNEYKFFLIDEYHQLQPPNTFINPRSYVTGGLFKTQVEFDLALIMCLSRCWVFVWDSTTTTYFRYTLLLNN